MTEIPATPDEIPAWLDELASSAGPDGLARLIRLVRMLVDMRGPGREAAALWTARATLAWRDSLPSGEGRSAPNMSDPYWLEFFGYANPTSMSQAVRRAEAAVEKADGVRQ